MKYIAVVMKPTDNVATVLQNVSASCEVELRTGNATVVFQVQETIPSGHKFALSHIAQGELVRKYGEVIGVATQSITPGHHVHVHNLESRRGRGDRIE